MVITGITILVICRAIKYESLASELSLCTYNKAPKAWNN